MFVHCSILLKWGLMKLLDPWCFWKWMGDEITLGEGTLNMHDYLQMDFFHESVWGSLWTNESFMTCNQGFGCHCLPEQCSKSGHLQSLFYLDLEIYINPPKQTAENWKKTVLQKRNLLFQGANFHVPMLVFRFTFPAHLPQRKWTNWGSPKVTCPPWN